MLDETKKSVYENVVYQSDTDAKFADQLEKSSAVKVHAKLPGWFQVPTPLGPYTSDWAVLVETDEGERLYLVIETKASLHLADLRARRNRRKSHAVGALPLHLARRLGAYVLAS